LLCVCLSCLRGQVYTYHIGGPVRSLRFIWRVGDERDENAHARNITIITSEKLHVYYGRQLLKDFSVSFSPYNVSAPQMKSIFKYLTNDYTAPNHGFDKDTQARLQLVIDGGPEAAFIIPDLRLVREGRASQFDPFWEVLGEVLAERTRVDDRRHGTVEHFSDGCSARSLHEMTVERLRASLEEGHDVPAIPSIEWMRLQFSPSCLLYNTSVRYNGRFEVQYHVQKRTLHMTHIDKKYCYILQQYQQAHALKHASDMEYVMIDDKANIAVGKPGCAVATVSRGRKVLTVMVS
jgi:cell cycle checkpoint protein